MFFVAALVNLARAGGHDNPRRPIRLGLAASCVLWGIGAYLFRFRSETGGILLAVIAGVLMLYAGLVSGKLSSERD